MWTTIIINLSLEQLAEMQRNCLDVTFQLVVRSALSINDMLMGAAVIQVREFGLKLSKVEDACLDQMKTALRVGSTVIFHFKVPFQQLGLRGAVTIRVAGIRVNECDIQNIYNCVANQQSNVYTYRTVIAYQTIPLSLTLPN